MIRFSAGRWRWVILIPSLGIVLKFPRVYPLETLKGLMLLGRDLGREPWREIYDHYVCSNSAFIRHALGGWLDNLGEAWFWWYTKHPFLQPTYFSLVGLVNIQRYGRPTGLERPPMLLWGQHTNWAVYRDGHHFGEADNFCRDRNGFVHLHDYGRPITQRIVRQYGDLLATHIWSKPLDLD